MPRPTNRTPKNRRDWKSRFIAALASAPNVSAAAQAAGITRTYAYDARLRDPEFAAKWDETIEGSIDELAAEAYRRATKGCEKPVYQGGVKVGSVQEYSDTLAIFLLKSHRPEIYRESTRQEISGPNGGPIQAQLESFNAALSKIYPSASLESPTPPPAQQPASLEAPRPTKPKPVPKPKPKYKPRTPKKP